MPTVEQAGTVNVGWVQGGAPGGGIYGLGPARTITRNQTRETYALMDEVDAGRLPRPSFIVWPENSTDLDPRYDFQTHSLVGSSVSRAKAEEVYFRCSKVPRAERKDDLWCQLRDKIF